jgi:hypothetical protein
VRMSVTPISRQMETSMPPTIFRETMSMGGAPTAL